MNRPRITRWLRITWTAFFGLTAVLLVSLWVRSYRWNETIVGPLSKSSLQAFGSTQGKLCTMHSSPFPQPGEWRYGVEEIVPGDDVWVDVWPEYYQVFGLGFRTFGTTWMIAVPHWFAIIFVAAVAALPWIRPTAWKFSLRTLLIATTLVGIVLGL